MHQIYRTGVPTGVDLINFFLARKKINIRRNSLTFNRVLLTSLFSRRHKIFSENLINFFSVQYALLKFFSLIFSNENWYFMCVCCFVMFSFKRFVLQVR